MRKRRLASLVLAAGVAALASAAVAPAAQRGASVKPAPPEIGSVRGLVERWLGSVGLTRLHVGEVMAFSVNYYVALDDKNGAPAVELLVGPDGSWLMEEPASMMWNTRYGLPSGKAGNGIGPFGDMMSGYGMMAGPGSADNPWTSWYGNGSGKVTSVGQAVKHADAWLAKARPGEKAKPDGRAFPGYFTVDTARGGKTFGMMSVNASTGAIWYHGWHGTFVSERLFK